MSDSKYINKINALLAKAASTEHEAEREECLRLADQMMMRHAIDRSQISGNNDVKPEGVVQVHWNLSIPYEFHTQIWSAFSTVTRHCNLRAVNKWNGTVSVIGYESDIQYAELLWPVVYRDMAGNLFPNWKTDDTFQQNVYRFVKGGYKWKAIAFEANKHGCEVKWPDGGKLKRAYHAECRARSEEPTAHTQRHEAFRASYATAFASTIRQRLDRMRQAAADTVDERDRFALAIRDTMERVNEEFYKMYPQFDPAYIDKMSAAERERYEAWWSSLTPEQQAAETKKQERLHRAAERQWERTYNKTYDSNGWRHGTTVAKNVDLSLGKGHITPNRSEIAG